MPKKTKIDYQLLALILSLVSFGLIALYSASTVESFENFGNTTGFIFHQMLYGVGIGLILMTIFSKIDYHVWQKLLPGIILISLLLLALVKAPGVGFSAGGATRWIHFGQFFFQPAELAKLALILYLAAWSAKNRAEKTSFVFGLLPSLVIVALFSVLILWQPDFGTMSVALCISAVMLFCSGVSIKRFFWTALAGFSFLLFMIKTEPYRWQRITSFLNPSHDPQGSGYQISQSLLAIGAGGLWGYGYGFSRQKYSYLPEPMGDSIFAVMAEELGFVRIMLLLLLFTLFLFKGRQIAKNAPDAFGKMIAVGTTVWIISQALINIGSMVGILPLTGVPLPFFSYGSSALLVSLSAMGILLNISRQARH
ncbi:MAG: putative lipid II flippase FtsW [Candidatus Doudnabacteria bacterium]|nr:putative lipid II flippase FtsW [Candidatus Doudnabacteria bacterium]